ncbi:enoyl-CoA hydratase/isomerase family protein, partial [Chloroflexota bacterium]
IVPGGGQTQRLPRQIGVNKAKELLFTGDRLSASEAERIGMINRVVPPERLEEAAMEMAEKVLRNIPETMMTMKRLINSGLKTDLESGLKMEAEVHKGPITPTAEGRKRMMTLLEKK